MTAMNFEYSLCHHKNQSDFNGHCLTNSIGIYFSKLIKVSVSSNSVLEEVAEHMNKYVYQIGIQYLKEMIVHSPKSPAVFSDTAALAKHVAKFDINVAVAPQNENNSVVETILKITGTSSKEEDESDSLYTITIGFGCLTNITHANGVDPTSISAYTDLQIKRYIAAVEVPYLLFPAIRYPILWLTREMSFMPVQLNPVNFHALFVKNLREEKQN